MKDRNEILHKYTSDMLGIENHFLDVLNYQVSDTRIKDYKEAHVLVIQIQDTIKEHVRVLERYIEKLGVESSKATTFKKAATKVTGVTTGLYNLMRREDSVMRNLRDDYTALNMAAISYTMLHSTALALDDGELAALSLKNLKELTPLVVELSRAIPAVVIEELSVEGKALDTMAIARAIENTQQAWSREIIG